MLAALINLKSKEILKIYNFPPININIPDTWQAFDVDIGFKTPDNIYEVVNVIPFVVPSGKNIVGEPTYSFNEKDEVIETFQVEDIKPITIIQAPDFIARFTDEEYSNIKNAALNQMKISQAQLQKWIDIATSEGFIDLNRDATQQAKAALVAFNLLTKERADIIFS